ncbi:hypothetical protein IHE44_0012339 [Lamprotornis superbus]|uniref:Uncharacterized protein n=1 Tax=Lamprotornis superbus TaxID=245042 RepID=A0A835TVR3_9PASS|nr:hypothetical protein IHE44_0012339 [Lamprotornis superbus]
MPRLEDILLINSKCSSKKATTLQTVKVPRSNVLDRVQSFLPQMAQANDELKRKMVTAPAHQFDIEHLDSETEKVIEMNVAVVELSDSDTDEELLTSEDDSESDEDDSVTDEVTVDNIKFPKQKGEKGKIEILDSKANEPGLTRGQTQQMWKKKELEFNKQLCKQQQIFRWPLGAHS